MNANEQRIALASAFPHAIRDGGKDFIVWQYFDGEHWCHCKGNDPLADLNALHAMETLLLTRKTGWRETSWRYIKNLQQVRKLEWYEEYTDIAILVHSTAAQRAETLCRVLWPERWKG